MLNRRSFLKSTGSFSGLFLPVMSFPQFNMIAANDQPLLTKATLKNSYWYIGHLLSVLLKSADTNGLYSLLKVTEIKGLEPPPHTHTREHETFLLLDGEIEFSVKNETYHAIAGDTMFLPRNIQHSFKVITAKSEVLILLTPGGFEQFFIEMSEPAQEMKEAPLPSGPPDIARLIATAAKYGVKFPDNKGAM
ncbi:cupin domain-containing protein [Chitinophaga ginsengisegetis]|uniref:cupin domain-containing protein n=1 Tax=Chitinophaga ginsengisegetis TaxID=393003 RepID=UPI003415C25E